VQSSTRRGLYSLRRGEACAVFDEETRCYVPFYVLFFQGDKGVWVADAETAVRGELPAEWEGVRFVERIGAVAD
jgi:hypothetical protein